MKIIVATSNQDKLKEIKAFLKTHQIYALKEILTPFKIEEYGTSFKENALIKAKAVYEKLSAKQKDEFMVLSDDSGISVEALNFAPGIYSARYSGKDANSEKNRAKLISSLKKLNLKQSRAFYTAAIAVAGKFGEFCVHGFMHGMVIDEERGANGFGYDALFIPDGFNLTLGELTDEIKLEISHRSKALRLMQILLKALEKEF